MLGHVHFLKHHEDAKSIKDYQKENLRHIRALQKRRQREQEEEKERLRASGRSRSRPLKATMSLEQVQSKVKPMMMQHSHALKNRESKEQNGHFLRSHAKSGPFSKDGSGSSRHMKRTHSLDLGSALSVKSQEAGQKIESSTQWDSEDEELFHLDYPPSIRFSEVSVEERRSRISQLLTEICSTAPLSEGRGLTRSPSLTCIEMRCHSSSPHKSQLERTSSKVKIYRERSVQTDREENLDFKPPVKETEGHQSIQSKEKQRSFKDQYVDATGSVEDHQEVGKNNQENISKIDSLHNHQIDEETRQELRLNLDGIEGAFKEDDQAKLKPNYITANKESASVYGLHRRLDHIKATKKKEKESRLLLPGKHNPGSVPKYLKVRQEQWKEEERRQKSAKPDPDCPMGHRRLSETERLKSLEAVKETHKELLAEVNSFRVSSDTLRSRERRRQIEMELNKLEENIRKYSRPVVYVRKDVQEKFSDL